MRLRGQATNRHITHPSHPPQNAQRRGDQAGVRARQGLLGAQAAEVSAQRWRPRRSGAQALSLLLFRSRLLAAAAAVQHVAPRPADTSRLPHAQTHPTPHTRAHPTAATRSRRPTLTSTGSASRRAPRSTASIWCSPTRSSATSRASTGCTASPRRRWRWCGDAVRRCSVWWFVNACVCVCVVCLRGREGVAAALARARKRALSLPLMCHHPYRTALQTFGPVTNHD